MSEQVEQEHDPAMAQSATDEQTEVSEDKPTDTAETNQQEPEDKQEDEEKQTKKEEARENIEAAKRQRQFLSEFNNLKDSLEKEATRIIRPKFQQYTPYIHTSLAPYYNTYTVQFLLDLPPHVRHGYITRKTAVGIVDPEVSHNMDIDLDNVPDSKPISVLSMDGEFSPRSQGLAGGREGSTRLPKWPVVRFKKTEDPNKRLNWGDVPKIRESLKTQYSSNAQDRIRKDYERTKQDWVRMELDKLQKIHEFNRSHMKITCGTYLGTSPGSTKAVKSLTKVLE